MTFDSENFTYHPWKMTRKHPQPGRMSDTCCVFVQVNGRTRSSMTVPRGLTGDEARAKAIALPEVERFTAGIGEMRTVWVPDRLLGLWTTPSPIQWLSVRNGE